MILKIKVYPKSSRQEVLVKDGIIKVYIRTSPDKGKANDEVKEVVAKFYKTKKRLVKIIKGKTNRNKVLEIQF